MPTQERFLQYVAKIPEIRVLENCARRSGVRFGIRGGIIRSLVFGLDSERPNASLYDFVDSFSDIDLVVSRESDWRMLGPSIVSSLPFAGFHRWEVKTYNEIGEHAKSYVFFPLDRLILWLDPQAHPFLSVEDILGDPEHILRVPSVEPELRIGFGSSEDPIGRLLTFLRFTRYYLQFPRGRGRHHPESMWHRLEIGPNISRNAPPLSGLNRRRIELGLLHVIFNSTDSREAVASLQQILSVLPERWHQASQVVRKILEPRFAAAPMIGAAVYRPKRSPEVRTRIFSHQAGSSRSSTHGPASVIPWTRLSAFDDDDGCCRYRDFRLGPAVIAWRGGQLNNLADEDIEGYGVVAEARSPRGYRDDLPSMGNTLPIPGFVQRGSSVVLRFDHAYVASVTGRNLQFFVGLARTLLPEESQ